MVDVLYYLKRCL